MLLSCDIRLEHLLIAAAALLLNNVSLKNKTEIKVCSFSPNEVHVGHRWLESCATELELSSSDILFCSFYIKSMLLN